LAKEKGQTTIGKRKRTDYNWQKKHSLDTKSRVQSCKQLWTSPCGD